MDTEPSPIDTRLTKKLAEQVRAFRALVILLIAILGVTVVAQAVAITVLWGIHNADISSLRSEVLQRSKDRITRTETMGLFEMHAGQPHRGAMPLSPIVLEDPRQGRAVGSTPGP